MAVSVDGNVSTACVTKFLAGGSVTVDVDFNLVHEIEIIMIRLMKKNRLEVVGFRIADFS